MSPLKSDITFALRVTILFSLILLALFDPFEAMQGVFMQGVESLNYSHELKESFQLGFIFKKIFLK